MPCDNPLWLNRKGVEMPVPCGKCPPCKQRRVSEWVFRIMWEEQNNSVSSHFVTLTYNSEHVPLTPHGFMSLRKKHLQDYFKRLRKLCPGFSLKYYACGEYGGQFSRPHYHFICFNCPDPQFFSDAWALGGIQFGNVFVGTATGDSTAYVLKYIDKTTQTRWAARHQRDDREPEFSVQSKGIGAGYVNVHSVAYHTADLNRNYVTNPGGFRVAMPRYYRKKIFSDTQLELQRDIINVSVSARLEQDRVSFLQNNPGLSYADACASAVEDRLYNFTRALKKRKDL